MHAFCVDEVYGHIIIVDSIVHSSNVPQDY